MRRPAPQLSIPEVLAARAAEAPQATAILAPGRQPLTYRRLLEQVQRSEEALRTLGVGSGDCVAVALPNGPEMAVAFLAVAGAAVCAPLNPAYRGAEFDYYLSDLAAKALIVPAGADSAARRAAEEHGVAVVELEAEGAEAGAFSLRGAGDGPPRQCRSAGPESVALVLHTSGTTSRPKMVPLTHLNLCSSAGNVARSLALTAGDRCVNVMPLFHIHGLVAALLSPLSTGGSVVCTAGFNADRFLALLDEFAPTWYTAVPTMHQALLTHVAGRSGALPAGTLRFIRSSSSPLPPRVMAQMEDAFAAPVVEAYGMTEAAHQISANPLPPGRRKPGSVGLPTGTEVAIMNASGDHLPRRERGEIVIRGPNVTHGYRNDPTADRAAFASGWFRTGDEGFVDEDGYLFITGRLKEMINRGGEKVSPREVDEALLEHPAVAQAVAFAVPHPALGEDVAAAVVLKEGAAATGAEILDFAAGRLASLKVPRQVIVVDDIPKGATGKLQRIGLAERLADRLRSPYAEPRDFLERLLASLWGRLLEAERVGVHDNFFVLGGSSLVLVAMLARVRAAFGVKVSFDEALRHPTVAELAGRVREGLGASAAEARARRLLADLKRGGPDPWQAVREMHWPCLVPVQPLGTKPPLFVVSFGVTDEAENLATRLGLDQPVYALRPWPHVQDLTRRLEPRALAAHCIAEMQAVRPRGTYVLAGACAAGVVAFEMARQLCAAGQSVPLLALFDVYYPLPPQIPYGLGVFLLRLPRTIGLARRLTPADRRVYYLKRARVWAGRIARRLVPWPLRAAGRHSSPDDPPLEHSQAMADSSSGGVWRYRPRPYPGRLALFLSTETATWPFPDRRLGWRRAAAGPLDVRWVPGEHHHALEEPHVAVAARKLAACLDGAVKPRSAPDRRGGP